MTLVDVDASPRIAERERIVGLPTVVVIKDGREVERRIGLMAGDRLFRLLDRYADRRTANGAANSFQNEYER